MRYINLLLAILIVAVFSSCKQKSSHTSGESELTDSNPVIKAADFNADTAYYFVNKHLRFHCVSASFDSFLEKIIPEIGRIKVEIIGFPFD